MLPDPKTGVAFVYPPFGPAGLPSLGLGILEASIKKHVPQSKTYYWNLHFMSKLPGSTAAQRMRNFWWLTGRAWHPFSEWIFSRIVHDDALDYRETETITELEIRSLNIPEQSFKARDLLRLRDAAEDLIAEAMEEIEPYSIIGIATTFYQNLPALALARRIKKKWPEKQVVLGGANCDGVMGRALARNFPFIDYVFTGEVDHSFPEYVRRTIAGESVEDIAGIVRRKSDGTLQLGPPAEPLQDMDTLPLPDFTDFIAQRERYGAAECQETTLALESSRGCWWGARQHCVFCGLNANGMGYRKKSVDRFQWELEETVRQYRPRYIFMTDNILPMEYQNGFLDWARDADLGVRFFYEIKSNVKRSQVKSMAAAGLTAVQPGIESFSSSLLSLMQKGVSGPQNIAFLRYAREYGIRSSYNLLVGFPQSTDTDYSRMADSLPLLTHLRPPSAVVPIEFHRFSPYHERPADYGLELHPSDAYSHLYPFPKSELADIGYVFYGDQSLPQDGSFERLLHLVDDWQKQYEENNCSLTWSSSGNNVHIQDNRPGFGPRSYRLERYACDLFHQLDEPRALPALIKTARAVKSETESDVFWDWLLTPQSETDQTVIRFEASDFIEDPTNCLNQFRSAGLLFEDTWIAAKTDIVTLGGAARHETRYVALPVHFDYQPEDTGWNSVGV